MQKKKKEKDGRKKEKERQKPLLFQVIQLLATWHQ